MIGSLKGTVAINTASDSEIQALNSSIMQSAAIPTKLNVKRKLQVSMFVWYRIEKLWTSAIFRFCDNGPICEVLELIAYCKFRNFREGFIFTKLRENKILATC